MWRWAMESIVSSWLQHFANIWKIVKITEPCCHAQKQHYENALHTVSPNLQSIEEVSLEIEVLKVDGQHNKNYLNSAKQMTKW